MPSLILNGNKIGGTVDDSALLRYNNEESTLESTKVQNAITELDNKVNTNLAEAKEYSDNIKNDLLNGAGEAYDTLKELGELIDDNKDAIDVLETIASSKADANHDHNDKYYTESEIDSKLSTINTNVSNNTSAITQLNSNLSTHTSNKSNPHGVTAAQVGALSTSGGNVNGTINMADKLWLKVDGEGGNIRFTSKDATHHWEMDANNNKDFRLYHGTNTGHANGAVEYDKGFYFEGETGRMRSDAGAFALTTDNVASATKLATARNIQTNLGSTSAKSFDGTAAIEPGIKGTLGLGNGGTGATSKGGACQALFGTNYTAPAYVCTYPSSGWEGGYSSITDLKKAMGLGDKFVRWDIAPSSTQTFDLSGYIGKMVILATRYSLFCIMVWGSSISPSNICYNNDVQFSYTGHTLKIQNLSSTTTNYVTIV